MIKKASDLGFGGRMEEAMELWREMASGTGPGCSPNTVTYSTLMDGLSKAGRVEEAMSLLDNMKRIGLGADAYVYGALVSGLCNAGSVDGPWSSFTKCPRRRFAQIWPFTAVGSTVYPSLGVGRRLEICCVT
ncbi:hypothetical protein ZIOFF_067362 [Zingiber officinale]|uniref:Pentatricopeptide repeat-containing protein n=1 Tax=Zingiber officinale TaxID=94328 RepID=A0A8J5EVF5_ZINOF|nr:hypothetical protein ZIOFF_069098 [Zingiber officinale]KAG6473446.1 hypothetical protein ZIOFF_067362 [Zingiber officinale]